MRCILISLKPVFSSDDIRWPDHLDRSMNKGNVILGPAKVTVDSIIPDSDVKKILEAADTDSSIGGRLQLKSRWERGWDSAFVTRFERTLTA